MTQSQPPNPTPDDRLARVEAALENQVQVNAELLTRLEILSNTAQSQQASIADLRVTAQALVSTTEIHQQNFEVFTQELRQQRADITLLTESQRQLTESQRTTNSTLDRMGAILEFLVQERGT